MKKFAIVTMLFFTCWWTFPVFSQSIPPTKQCGTYDAVYATRRTSPTPYATYLKIRESHDLDATAPMPVTITTVEKATNKPISQYNMRYGCSGGGGYQPCSVGFVKDTDQIRTKKGGYPVVGLDNEQNEISVFSREQAVDIIILPEFISDMYYTRPDHDDANIKFFTPEKLVPDIDNVWHLDHCRKPPATKKRNS